MDARIDIRANDVRAAAKIISAYCKEIMDCRYCYFYNDPICAFAKQPDYWIFPNEKEIDNAD